MKLKERETVVCDIDGTIADNSHRQHYLEEKKDWKSFFLAIEKDKPIFKILKKIEKLYLDGFQIIFITGRPEEYRLLTQAWLKKYLHFNYTLLMRENNDWRDKIEIKKELFEKNLKNLKISIVFENDKDLCILWESLGLKVFKVNESDFE